MGICRELLLWTHSICEKAEYILYFILLRTSPLAAGAQENFRQTVWGASPFWQPACFFTVPPLIRFGSMPPR